MTIIGLDKKRSVVAVLLAAALLMTVIAAVQVTESSAAGASGGGTVVLSKSNFGGADSDTFKGVAATSDGGFVAVGYAQEYSFGTGDLGGIAGYGGADALAVKYDSNGMVKWVRTFGGEGNDIFYSVTATSDGGVIAVGYSYVDSFGTGSLEDVEGYGSYDAIAVKYDSNGMVKWIRNFGGEGDDVFYGVAATSDGGFVAVGYSYVDSFGIGSWDGVAGYGYSDAIAVKYDSNGTVKWAKNFGGESDDDFSCVAATSDGGFIAAGYSSEDSFGTGSWDGVAGYGNGDAIVVRFDGSGTVKWAKNFGGADYDRFRSVAATSDGGFIAAGLSYEGSFGTGSWDGVPGYGSYDSIAVKYDKNGALEWAKNFGGVGDEGFNSIAATSDGGFIVVGYSSEDSFGTGDWVDVTGYGDYDATIIKCDGSGTVEWLTNFGGGSYEYFYAVTVISDGGLVAAGYSYEDSFGTGNWEGVEGHGYFDGMVVKYKGLDPIAPGVKNNYINASSDSNSTITPSGVVTVQRFNDQTFHFSAADGYVVSSVTVDGRLLTQEQIDSGSYTFTNVMMNHIIDVKSSVAASVTLTIDITEGKGYAKYSTDGLSFLDYTSPVILAYGTELFVVPVPEDGYTFSTWKVSTEAHPDEVTAEPNLHFDSVTGNTHLTLYFEIGSGGTAAGDSGIWLYVLGIVILLIIAGILLWFFLFYRRYYDVLKNESLNIAGADRVHRKSEYRFKVEGYSGMIVYRIGDKEDAVWKTILPNADGSFVIPKEEITGDVTIEPR